MAKAFSIRDLMGDGFRQQDESDVYKKVSVYDVASNPENEYSLSEIEKMKDSIFALGGIQQNVVIVEFPNGAEGHKYLALDGHRRLLASRELVEEGYHEFEFVPAVIKGKLEAGMDEAVLVMMNSTQRSKTDWEKVMEHMKLKEIIPRLKKRQGIDGRTRDIEADMLGVSRTQVNIYNTIGTRLSADLMEMFRQGSIGISVAYEAAKQETSIQDKIVGLARGNGSVTEEDIKQLSGSRVCDWQQTLSAAIPSKTNVSESDTFKESGQMEKQSDAKDKSAPPTDDEILYLYNHAIKEYDDDRSRLAERLKETEGRRYRGHYGGDQSYQFSPKGVKINGSVYVTTFAELVRRLNKLIPKKENVSESDTSRKNQIQTACTPPEKKIVCTTTNEDDVDAAIYFIFRMDDFPEDKLQELISCYMAAENNTNASISAEIRFNKMLPYENGNIMVTRKNGYKIEYVHTGEIHNIPCYHFWKGFEREFIGSVWKREETGTGTTDENEKLIEPCACDKPLAAVQDEDGGREIKFRGGYEPVLVDDLIRQYTSYCEIIVPEKEKDIARKQICMYNCLLDALELLRERLKSERSKNDI